MAVLPGARQEGLGSWEGSTPGIGPCPWGCWGVVPHRQKVQAGARSQAGRWAWGRQLLGNNNKQGKVQAAAESLPGIVLEGWQVVGWVVVRYGRLVGMLGTNHCRCFGNKMFHA